MRFKEQYDASRVPIFTPAGETGNGSGPGEVHISDNTDMILAAAMQAEDARGGRPVITNGRVSDSVSRQQQQTQDSRGHGHSEGEGDLPRIADAVQTSVAILVSMMQVSLSLIFKGVFLYIVFVLCHLEWCIRHLWFSSIILYIITSIAHNHRTHNNPL